MKGKSPNFCITSPAPNVLAGEYDNKKQIDYNLTNKDILNKEEEV